MAKFNIEVELDWLNDEESKIRLFVVSRMNF